MVHIEEIRSAFAARLKQALAASEIPAWGAGARLSKLTGVTPKACSKWLNGESMPGGQKMLALASALQVRVEWLEYGRGEMIDKGEEKTLAPQRESNVEPGPPITTAPRRIEIVGTAQLGNDGYWVGLDNSDGWVETWSRDEDAYALRLKGDSMAPAIRSGWVAVCEPNHRLVPGEYVMVTTTDGQSMVKELLFESEESVSVMSVNSAYERRTIDWSDIEKIHYVGNILAPSKILSRI